MFLEVMLFSITCRVIFSLRLYLTLDEIKEILSPSFVLGSLFSFCWLPLGRMLPRLRRVMRIRPKGKIFIGVSFNEGVYYFFCFGFLYGLFDGTMCPNFE